MSDNKYTTKRNITNKNILSWYTADGQIRARAPQCSAQRTKIVQTNKSKNIKTLYFNDFSFGTLLA